MVPRRDTPDRLDVPETDSTGPTVRPGTGGRGQGLEYTEFNNLPHGGRQPDPFYPGQTLIYVSAPGPDGSRPAPKLVRVSDRNTQASLFPENKPSQETRTTVTWQPFQQSSAYLLSCHPMTQRQEKMFQVRGTGTAFLLNPRIRY